MCKQCPAGSIAPQLGSVQTQPCPAGTISATNGSTVCTPCAVRPCLLLAGLQFSCSVARLVFCDGWSERVLAMRQREVDVELRTVDLHELLGWNICERHSAFSRFLPLGTSRVCAGIELVFQVPGR